MEAAPKLCPRCLREYGLAQSFCPFDGEALTRQPLPQVVSGRPSSRESGLFAERYAVRGILGKGAMTHVLLGEDTITREPVAIKVLDVSFLGRPEIVERFTREAEALRHIRHPNIIRSLAAGEGADGLPFHILEYLQGESLDLMLQREHILPLYLSLNLLILCASALEAAHQQGIWHRDLKPANLMIFHGIGHSISLKLVDFGFAHVNGSSIVTPPGTALGTVAYMAPEQIVGDRTDGRSDLYSLGILAFRLITGELPFRGEGLDHMACQLIQPIPPVIQIVQPVPDGVARIIARATQKNPDYRYPSAREMKEDLQQVLANSQDPLITDALPPGGKEFSPSPGLPQQAARFLYDRLGLTIPTWKEEA